MPTNKICYFPLEHYNSSALLNNIPSVQPPSPTSSIEGKASFNDQQQLVNAAKRQREQFNRQWPPLDRDQNAAKKTKPKPGSQYVCIGDGPRTLMYLTEMVELGKSKIVIDVQNVIKELGGKYPPLNYVVISPNDRDALGRGVAWNENQGWGTPNTGSAGYGEGIASATEKFFNERREELLNHRFKAHPVIASLTESAFNREDGKLMPQRAFGTRVLQGEIMHEYFTDNLQVLPPPIEISVVEHARAEKVKIAGAGRQFPLEVKVLPSGKHDGKEAEVLEAKIKANEVYAHTGTTTTDKHIPEKIKPWTLAGVLKPEEIKQQLEKWKLLRSGKLESGKKLACGGTSLSALDLLLALHEFMDLFEADPGSHTGYKVTETAKKKYPGALICINRTPGKITPPLHYHDSGIDWTQPVSPFGSPYILHALFLHKDGSEVCSAWRVIEEATIAAGTGMTPKETNLEGMSTEEVLSAYHSDTEKYANNLERAKQADDLDEKNSALRESTHTLVSAKRQAYIGTTGGIGICKDTAQAEAALEEYAPFTFGGIFKDTQYQAQLKGISESGGNNADLMKIVREHDHYIIASPWIVQEMFYALQEAGILRFLKGSYENAEVDADNKTPGFSFPDKDAENGRTQIDALLVSESFERNTPLTNSLIKQVRKANGGPDDLPQVGRFRRVITTEGKLSDYMDHGLNSSGADLENGSKVNIFADGVNHLPAAAETEPGLALREWAKMHLAAAGIEPERLDELYDQFLPKDEEYKNEVLKFKPYFEEGMDLAAYLKAVKDIVDKESLGDGEAKKNNRLAYRIAVELGRDFKTREDILSLFQGLTSPAAKEMRMTLSTFVQSNIGQSEDEYVKKDIVQYVENDAIMKRVLEVLCEAIPKYKENREHSRKEEFSPASKEAYQNRYVDVPLSIHEKVYKKACELAVEHLKKNSTGS